MSDYGHLFRAHEGLQQLHDELRAAYDDLLRERDCLKMVIENQEKEIARLKAKLEKPARAQPEADA